VASQALPSGESGTGTDSFRALFVHVSAKQLFCGGPSMTTVCRAPSGRFLRWSLANRTWITQFYP